MPPLMMKLAAALCLLAEPNQLQCYLHTTQCYKEQSTTAIDTRHIIMSDCFQIYIENQFIENATDK